MQHKRSKQFVDRSVQGRLVLRVLAHWVVFLVGSFSVLTVWQLLLSGDPLNPVSAQLQDIWVHSAPVFVVLAVLIPVFVWDTVKFSNRFTGPMYRLRSSIRDLAQGGEPRPIKFRDGDFWVEVADDFNEMIKRLPSESKSEADTESAVVEADTAAAEVVISSAH